ncbi:hypothetical protein [Microbacterium protaetiae]|nr:hypothetical protein [Microbacterium protaetiae]
MVEAIDADPNEWSTARGLSVLCNLGGQMRLARTVDPVESNQGA